MSENLYFKVKTKPTWDKTGSDLIDFPFQTPTYLTLAVKAQHNKKDQLKILSDYFKANYKRNDDWATETMEKITAMFNDENLILTSM